MNQEVFGKAVNYVIYALGIAAGAVLLFFFAAAVVSAFYKGKKTGVKILKKREVKFKRSRNRRRGGNVNERYSRSKIDVEVNGEKKTLKCNDLVILDKLSVGGSYSVRVKFGSIVKILR